MANLATVADVSARLGRSLDQTEEVRVELLLGDASAAVRTYTGRTFEEAERTVRVRARTNLVRLADPPISAVSAVADIDGNDVSYRWDGLDTVYLWPLGDVRFDLDVPTRWPQVVDVTYTAGADDVPDAVVAVVAQVAARAFGVNPQDSGHQQESIAGYSYSVGTAAASGAVGLLKDEREVLDRYRRVGGVAWNGP